MATRSRDQPRRPDPVDFLKLWARGRAAGLSGGFATTSEFWDETPLTLAAMIEASLEPIEALDRLIGTQTYILGRAAGLKGLKPKDCYVFKSNQTPTIRRPSDSDNVRTWNTWLMIAKGHNEALKQREAERQRSRGPRA